MSLSFFSGGSTLEIISLRGMVVDGPSKSLCWASSVIAYAIVNKLKREQLVKIFKGSKQC